MNELKLFSTEELENELKRREILKTKIAFKGLAIYHETVNTNEEGIVIKADGSYALTKDDCLALKTLISAVFE